MFFLYLLALLASALHGATPTELISSGFIVEKTEHRAPRAVKIKLLVTCPGAASAVESGELYRPCDACPAGKWGTSTGPSSSACSGQCPAGRRCMGAFAWRQKS